MRLRGTFALVAVAIALGLYVWWVEIRGADQNLKAEAAARTILALEPKEVTGLSLPTSDRGSAVLARSGESDWRLESPVAYPANPDTVERALRVLEKLESTSAIEPKPAELDPFGLGETRKTVEVRAGASAPQRFYIGGNTPVGGGRYFELASDPKRIFTVAAASLVDLEPTLVGLRDKRVLRVPTSAIRELSVQSGGALVVKATKTDAGWSLVEPEAAPADGDRIMRVLDDLALARASGFEDAVLPRAAYGLSNPGRLVTVRAGETEERLAIASHDGQTWLERAGDPVVLAVNPVLLTNVPETFFDYRAKRVLTLDVENVHALELAFPRSGQTRRLTRDETTWKSDQPDTTLKALALDDLLFALAELDATSVIEAEPDRVKLGLEPPLALIRAFDANGTLLGELTIGDPHPDTGLPAFSSQGPTLWRVSNDLGRALPLSPEAFTNLLVEPAPTTP